MAVRKKFSPEFVNRIDHVITYQPLDAESFAAITDHEIDNLQNHVNTRLGNRCFTIEVPFETRQWLIEKGTSPEYGARELKRTIHKTSDAAAGDAWWRRTRSSRASRVRVEVRAGSGVADAAVHRAGRGAGAVASDGAAGGRQSRSAAVSGAADGGIGLGIAGGGERAARRGRSWRSESRTRRCWTICCRTATGWNWRSS